MIEYLEELASYWITWLILSIICFFYSLPFIVIGYLAYVIGGKL